MHISSTPALEISGVSKTYTSGRVHALHDVSLTINQGDFFGLLGPNGAGKTTLISIITNLLLKDSGKISICGHDLDTDPVHAKTALGIVPQEFNFPIFEKVENIVYNHAGYRGFARKDVKANVETALKRLGLWDKRHAPARTLSGGMKRRLMIARALIHNPKILILDEPTAGVDIELRRDMWQYIRELNQQGLTIILTTHYLEEAEELCNNLAIINKGQIIRTGSKHALLKELKVRSVVLDFATPFTDEHLAAFGKYTPVREDQDSLVLTLQATDTMQDIFRITEEQHLAITDVRSKGNRLEELFLRLITQ